jgi:hypothetical protein
MQQRLYFFPLPQMHSAFFPIGFPFLVGQEGVAAVEDGF